MAIKRHHCAITLLATNLYVSLYPTNEHLYKVPLLHKTLSYQHERSHDYLSVKPYFGSGPNLIRTAAVKCVYNESLHGDGCRIEHIHTTVRGRKPHMPRLKWQQSGQGPNMGRVESGGSDIPSAHCISSIRRIPAFATVVVHVAWGTAICQLTFLQIYM